MLGKEPAGLGKAANYSVGIGQAAQGIGQRRHMDVLEILEVFQNVVIHFVFGKTHPGSAPAEKERETEREWRAAGNAWLFYRILGFSIGA